MSTALTCNERYDFDSETFPVEPIGFSSKDHGQDAGSGISPTLRSGNHTDSHANGGVPPAIAYAIQERAVCENPLAGPDGMGVRDDDCAYTMEARSVPQAVAYAFKPSHYTRGKDGAPSEVYPPLTADADKGDQDPVIAYGFQPRIARNGRGDMGDLVNALTAQAGETGKGDAAPCVAYMPARTFAADGEVDTRYAERPICDALHTSSGHGNKAPVVVQPEAFRVPGNVVPYSTGDRVDALTSANDSSAQFPIVQSMAVRRLMPVECERLQGFPDGWTLVPTGKKGKPAADGPRYKQLGNSMAVNCMRWIGRRLFAHIDELDEAVTITLDDEFVTLLRETCRYCDDSGWFYGDVSGELGTCGCKADEFSALLAA